MNSWPKKLKVPHVLLPSSSNSPFGDKVKIFFSAVLLILTSKLILPTLTYTLYPSKFNKNNFAGFTTSGSSLIAPGVTPPGAPFPVVENFLIAGKGQLKINH